MSPKVTDSSSSSGTYHFLTDDEVYDLEVARCYRKGLTLYPPGHPVQDYIREHRHRAQMARRLGFYPPIPSSPTTNCTTYVQVCSHCPIHQVTPRPTTMSTTTTITNTASVVHCPRCMTRSATTTAAASNVVIRTSQYRSTTAATLPSSNLSRLAATSQCHTSSYHHHRHHQQSSRVERAIDDIQRLQQPLFEYALRLF
ncbi:hypothetical protein BGZ73_006763 [Actinomortierella ambigua]|nr:hypothetical protein BGZ73_006756 [Actinomortierella ambigua]KAF9977183.1 hypothetical protein BGZ73_006763 [Actinomortierella ambigua]